jgi:hypothetical protein
VPLPIDIIPKRGKLADGDPATFCPKGSSRVAPGADHPYPGLAQRIAVPTSYKTCNDASKVVAMPLPGGLHHDYRATA